MRLNEYDKYFNKCCKEFHLGVRLLTRSGLEVIPHDKFIVNQDSPYIIAHNDKSLKIKIGDKVWESGLYRPEVASPLNRMWGIIRLLQCWSERLHHSDDSSIYGGISMSNPVRVSLDSRKYQEALELTEKMFPGTIAWTWGLPKARK